MIYGFYIIDLKMTILGRNICQNTLYNVQNLCLTVISFFVIDDLYFALKIFSGSMKGEKDGLYKLVRNSGWNSLGEEIFKE